MIKRISESVLKLLSDGNIHIIEGRTVIDAGSRSDRNSILPILSKAVDLEKVETLILTHMHYDHAGNFDVFPNAKIYASSEEIEDFHRDPEGTVLNKDTAEKLKKTLILPVPERIAGLDVIRTPGHTRGSICLWKEDEKILFSGDTLFFGKNIGRTDLPSSVPGEMQETLLGLLAYNYKILCPGHDY